MSAVEESIEPRPVVTRRSAPILNRILDFISSVRLGVFQLCLLVLLAMAGMLILQQNVQGFDAYYVSLTPAEKLVFGSLGLFDIYLLLWWGDILFDYGCYGFIMFAFWKLSPKWLLTAAFICFLLMIARENLDLYRDKQTIRRGEVIAAMDTTKVKLNEVVKATIKTASQLVYDSYETISANGSAILIDETSNSTVAAVLIKS